MKKTIKNLEAKTINTTKAVKGGNRLRGFGTWSTGRNR